MREGGSYTVDGTGKRTLEHRTKPHKDGPRSRDAKGKPRTATDPAAAPETKPAAPRGKASDKKD